jgi:HTH-type transcriptional regulator/antitoxin MqsA
MSDSNNLCPICGEGKLHHKVSENPVEYKGQTTELDLHFSLCDACGSEQADAAQTRINKRLMIAFKKRVDGLLIGAEVRALRERLELSQAEAAQVFGGGPVAFSKYESDDVAQSEAMDKLLRLAAELPSAFGLLCRRAGMERVLADEQWQQAESWLAKPRRPTELRRPTLRLLSSSTPSTDQQVRYRDAA